MCIFIFAIQRQQKLTVFSIFIFYSENISRFDLRQFRGAYEMCNVLHIFARISYFCHGVLCYRVQAASENVHSIIAMNK